MKYLCIKFNLIMIISPPYDIFEYERFELFLHFFHEFRIDFRSIGIGESFVRENICIQICACAPLVDDFVFFKVSVAGELKAHKKLKISKERIFVNRLQFPWRNLISACVNAPCPATPFLLQQ